MHTVARRQRPNRQPLAITVASDLLEQLHPGSHSLRRLSLEPEKLEPWATRRTEVGPVEAVAVGPVQPVVPNQQLPQMPSVRTVALCALLRPAQPRGLRRLGQMHARADPAQLLDHEPPAGRCLQRHLQLRGAETRQEPAHGRTIRRRHPCALHLAGLSIDPLAGDLSSMLVKSHYDAHSGPPQAPRLPSLRGHAPRLS